MRTTILTSIFFLSCIIVYGQQLTKEKFIGTWIVVDSQLFNDFDYDIELDEDGKEKLEEVKKGFVSTKFIFSADGIFNIELPPGIPEFMKEMEFVNNQRWIIEKDIMISIGSLKDRFSAMSILVNEAYGKTFFTIYESPFLLEVIKE